MMKLYLQLILITIIFAAGCSSSDKNANLASKGSQDSLSPNAADPTDMDFGDDFDLIAQDMQEQTIDIDDPLEGLNRITFAVNDVLYFWVVNPVAGTVEAVVPEFARIGVSNFFQNLGTPIRLVNCVLQGKNDSAWSEFCRFTINTTFGVAGFGDPALDQHGIEPVYEDLGQTLAVHGFENGCYLVIPLLGPSTLRDAGGKFGDMLLNPIFYFNSLEYSIPISATKFANESSFHIGEYETFISDAVDPYVAMRQAYILYRKKLIEE